MGDTVLELLDGKREVSIECEGVHRGGELDQLSEYDAKESMENIIALAESEYKFFKK